MTLRALAEVDPTCVSGLVSYGVTMLTALRESISFDKVRIRHVQAYNAIAFLLNYCNCDSVYPSFQLFVSAFLFFFLLLASTYSLLIILPHNFPSP